MADWMIVRRILFSATAIAVPLSLTLHPVG
jgi:hypothetical protein